ncbi:conserved hypothetical protein [Desulforamulus reducens MI-1]|uniref:IDEAL domain-containing protein n=1 Tax=Desulforamulus reducens (strain ATCC BAA-1160 / DSM 100696 / MI-1) TaxID=349161 RepID=A4J478_DESRM|nr:YpiB family protein [Desulforamulus reducens]ABO49881.1 conserved hypothetical protein [Desulforamulus reducens MI-1]
MLANNLAEKKELIVWFLRTNRLKKPEAARILEFIKDNKSLLSRIEFTNKLSDKKDALLVSAVYTNTFPFDFRLNNNHYGSVDEALYQLKTNPPHKLFMWLSFASPPSCALCSHRNNKQVRPLPNPASMAHKLLVEAVKTVNRKEAQKRTLLLEIDQSLDEKNIHKFQRLTGELQKLICENN